MPKTTTFQVRVTEQQKRRIYEMGKATGLNASAVLRLMIENAELRLHRLPDASLGNLDRTNAQSHAGLVPTP